MSESINVFGWNYQNIPFIRIIESQNHRIREYAEMEEIGRDQLLALCRTLQGSYHVPDSIVQILLEFRQTWCCDQASLWSLFNHPLNEKPFPIFSLNLP